MIPPPNSSQTTENEIYHHLPVLLNESIEGLDLKAGDTFVDCTLGNAGHTREVLRRFGQTVKVIAIDADSTAIARSKKVLEGTAGHITFVHDNFKNLDDILEKNNVGAVGGILLDLGLSSEELERSGRGFSFKRDEPLLMTFSNEPGKEKLTAIDIVNTWSESELERIISEYGEERFSRRIAEAIVAERKNGPFTTTAMLVNVIEKAIPAKFRHGRIHFATRTFQAIRIAVNDELEALSQALESGFRALRNGGRMAVISFHSLEDRTVKNYFKTSAKNGGGKILTKKPQRPSAEEINKNRRARSAKLRIIEKI